MVFVTCPTIAIDPEFRLRSEALNGKRICAFYRMTSGRFFEQRDPRTILGGPLDMVFIDAARRSGLHFSPGRKVDGWQAISERVLDEPTPGRDRGQTAAVVTEHARIAVRVAVQHQKVGMRARHDLA